MNLLIIGITAFILAYLFLRGIGALWNALRNSKESRASPNGDSGSAMWFDSTGADSSGHHASGHADCSYGGDHGGGGDCGGGDGGGGGD